MIKPLVGIIAILLISSALVVAGSQGSVYVLECHSLRYAQELVSFFIGWCLFQAITIKQSIILI